MPEDAAAAFGELLRALAGVWRAEGRPGGDMAADAYARAAASAPRPPPATPYRLDADILAATEGADHPAAVAARAAHRVLGWSATGILDQYIPPAVSDMFAVVALIGPGAMVEAEGVRAGLFMQRAGTYYPLHSHNAEETYAMLAGIGEWTLADRPPATRRAGDFIHHPAGAPHATRTGDRPLMAAWRWSGDIGLESYRMLEGGP